MSDSKDMLGDRIEWAAKLWKHGIATQFFHQKANPYMPEQMSYAESQGIQIGLVLRPKEYSEVRNSDFLRFFLSLCFSLHSCVLFVCCKKIHNHLI